MNHIYLDYAATTPLHPEVAEVMRSWEDDEYGNPSSLHAPGRRAKQAIDEAREQVSSFANCLFGEVTFTSSGTEACNLAIVGCAMHHIGSSRSRILLSSAEHHAVLFTSNLLRKLGYTVELIRVNRDSTPDLDHLESLLGDDVLLVSTMHANNETGAISDISSIIELSHQCGVFVHVDSVQTFGFGMDDFSKSGSDFLSFSAHKFYGPKGVGGLIAKAGTGFDPMLSGGGQEREMRAGTENVAGIIGCAEAIKTILSSPSIRDLRDRLAKELAPSVIPTLSSDTPHLASHFHCRADGLSAESVLIRLDQAGISASSGAACSSGSLEPSHVMLACGYSEAESNSALRFTVGKFTTAEEIDQATKIIREVIDGLSTRPGVK